MSSLKIDDVLSLELGNGIVDSWHIEGFRYGVGEGQESVIEIGKLGQKPSEVIESPKYGMEAKMLVPANLIHRAVDSGLLTVFQPGKIDA